MLRRAALLALLLVTSSCILKDERCGPGQVEKDEELEGCTCLPNHVAAMDGRSCTACGANEEPRGTSCACVAGYSKQGGVCMPTVVSDSGTPDSGTATAPTGEGEACESESDCASFDAKFCQNLQAPKQCLVKGCASGATKCFGSRVCCQYMALVPQLQPLADADGLCVEDATKCMAPYGTVVP